MTHNIYLESGRQRTFAVAVDWPGWARSGRSEEAALQALVDYAPRYARVLQSTTLAFSPPASPSDLTVIARLPGTATTDFGAPAVPLPDDSAPVTPEELGRWKEILPACWQAFDAAVQSAGGQALRKGPRGGGRELEKILHHLYESAEAYLKSLGGQPPKGLPADPAEALPPLREAILAALEAAARGELPARGPRGGERWTARYFVRRLAWHDLDHAWEIEDRTARLPPLNARPGKAHRAPYPVCSFTPLLACFLPLPVVVIPLPGPHLLVH